MIWSHIFFQRDIFVSRDKNYHKSAKKFQLIDAGAKMIMKPEEIIDYIVL